jgi:nitrous oxidase accessory protein NosD
MIGTLLYCLASVASAVEVNCERGQTIAAALKQATSGESIFVSGDCRENLVIPASAQDVVIDGQGKATITGMDAVRPVILVLGREIGIRHIRLVDGRNGISILRGASANVDGVTIEDSGRNRMAGSGLGINVGQHAFASVVNSTIRNNWNVGILVHENSGARIGFVDVASVSGPNTISGNGVGILVTEGAQARVVGATIKQNKQDGILVERGSHLEFADNTIEDNGGNGVTVTQSSGAVVEIGAKTVQRSNRTGTLNAGFGLACSLGGYAAGSLGSLNGQKGATHFTENCSNGLQP